MSKWEVNEYLWMKIMTGSDYLEVKNVKCGMLIEIINCVLVRAKLELKSIFGKNYYC